MQTSDEIKLDRLRGKLSNGNTVLLKAEAELAAAQAAVDLDVTDAAIDIEDRQPDKALAKKLAAAHERVSEFTTSRNALERAIKGLAEKIEAEKEEAKFARIQKLSTAINPKLNQWKKLLLELSNASSELLQSCERDDAYSDLGGRSGLGMLLFPPSDYRSNGADYEARCLAGQIFGAAAELKTHRQYRIFLDGR